GDTHGLLRSAAQVGDEKRVRRLDARDGSALGRAANEPEPDEDDQRDEGVEREELRAGKVEGIGHRVSRARRGARAGAGRDRPGPASSRPRRPAAARASRAPRTSGRASSASPSRRARAPAAAAPPSATRRGRPPARGSWPPPSAAAPPPLRSPSPAAP